MTNSQGGQNPDVNSYSPDAEPGESPNPTDAVNDGSSDIERENERDVIPIPPDASPAPPHEEPPGGEGPPVGDVDDSPKRIA